ncbi:PREDICTED: uncharacterized protein LOC106321760 [Brassica oleracea var. oleracea]|uniref:uncharacterized protein LOC106321760 n=1 Tax=Brassica oleracea var. oleracea TaxID=109376 RepID=UPI0006A6B09D|nr:PREDICTED: uncharacterized protein LOC106321760 [Brassica oleracea var. oleracea]
MKAITLRSGKQLSPRILTKDGEKQGGEVAINIDDEVVIVDEKVDEEILEKIVEAKGKGKVGEEKRTVKLLLQQRTPLLFLLPMSQGYHSLEDSKDSYWRNAVAAKKKEMEGMMILTHECSAIIQRLDVPRKLVDPGCFTLPCALGPMVFERCLYDLGASVSLMPLSIAKKLGFTQYKKCKLSLVLAYRSVKIPVGILENLPLMVGNFEIPTDFVVLEMGEEAQDPLILGKPFLATAGAIVNVRQGKIDLHLGQGNILHFDINEVMKKPTIQNQVFYIDEMDALADELLEELALEDSLQHALTIEREVQVIENEEIDAYVKMLDSHKGISGEGQNEELTYEAHHASSATQ